MIKKLTALLMAIILVLVCFGCSSDSVKDDERETEGIENTDTGNKDDEMPSSSSSSIDLNEEEDNVESQVTFKDLTVGDYIEFGKYEQDNNTSNGKEAIEWLVLDVQDGKALVISKYGLDVEPYHSSQVDVTWETCSLRSWLNNEFINNAFTAGEKAIIPTVTVSADENEDFDTDPGNSTKDKVFALSLAEANKYFGSNDERKCVATAYKLSKNISCTDGDICTWWLRSPGNAQNFAAVVITTGVAHTLGLPAEYYYVAVRPALWINLES